MKKLTKKICLMGLTLLSSMSFAFGVTNAKEAQVQARAASTLENEFTNNGQFAVGYYTGSTAYAYDFVDGSAEGLPAGYNGSVLRVASKATSGAPYVNLDFTASKISASMVESVVVRVYSPDYTSADELRINNTTGSVGGAGAYDLTSWCDVTLPLATITGADGNLGSFAFGLRDKGTISNYFYIDSITVNMKQTVGVTFNSINAWWNSNSYDNASCTFLMFDGGISGNGSLLADFSDLLSKLTLDGAPVDTANFSFYCPNWIGASGGIVMRIGANPQAGAVLTFPAGVKFNIGGTDTNLYEITEEFSLQFNGSTWALYEAPIENAELAVFKGPWGSAGDYNSEKQLLLQYSSTAVWNYANKGNLASKITYKNTQTGATYQVTDSDIAGWDGQRWIVLRNLSGYDRIEIAEGGIFGGAVEIPALTMQFNGTTWEEYQEPIVLELAVFKGPWGNADYYNSDKQLLLQYSSTTVWDHTDKGTLASKITYKNTQTGATYQVTDSNISGWENQRWIVLYGLEGYDRIEISAGGNFGGVEIPAITMQFDGTVWAEYIPPELATFVSTWTNADIYNSTDRVLLQYSGTTAWTYGDEGTLANKISYKNTHTGATHQATDADIVGWDGQKWIILSGLTGYDKIEISAGGLFGGNIEIPALTVYNVNGRWVTTAPHSATTNYVAMADGWNNAITNGISNNILRFDVNPLGGANNETNLAAKVSRTSLMVKYNGRTFADLYADSENPNAKQYNLSYAHGNGYVYFAIPEVDLADGAIFEIAEGTPFENNYLSAVKLQYNASTRTWVPYIELVYGEPTFGEATAANVGAWGWNHETTNTTVNKDTSYGYTIIADWKMDYLAENLAATRSTTSVSITFNGVSFYDLYQADNGYRLNAHLAYFGFSVPTSALVASNGYEYPTIEIIGGTPFYDGNYLPETTIIYKDGAWQLLPEEASINYSPDFVKIGDVNNLDNSTYWGLSLRYDTQGFAAANTQVEASSYLGFTLNREPVKVILWGGDQLLFWLPKTNCEAGYKGYTHATLVIKEGATLTNANGEVFTLGGVTLYLVDGLWTTEKPSGYAEGELSVPALGAPDCVYSGLVLNNDGANGMTLIEFTSFVNKPTVGESYLETTGYYITLNGVSLMEIPNANVYTWENQYWLRIDVKNPAEGSVMVIPEGTPFAGNYLPRLVFKFVDGVWCRAFTVNIEIDGETHVVYSENDVPVVIGDEYFADLLSEREIPGKAVSFTVRGVTYPAGTVFDVFNDTTVEVQTIDFNTTEGASIRLKTPTGIRFETKVSKADYDALVALYGEQNVELGTYIMPRTMLVGTDFRSYFADSSKTAGVDYVKIVNNGFANRETIDTDGYYLYYGSLVNLQPNNYCTDFFGIGYIKITDGGSEYIIYGGYDMEKYTRSIYYVAGCAYPDYANGTEDKATLKSYLDAVVYVADEAKLSTIVKVKGYQTPYSIAYNPQTGVYTVAGSTEIKSVMFGGAKRNSTRVSTLEIGGELYYVTDYTLKSSATYSTLTFKLSPVVPATEMVDFTMEVPSNEGVKILQITDTELMDATQMRTADALSMAEQSEYARKNIYANCFNYISELVEYSQPDLIVLTGDMIAGILDDNGTMLQKLIEFMDSFNIPWAPVFGGMEGESAKGTSWQRARLVAAQNCLYKEGNYTIGITDGGVLRRVLYMFDGSAGADIDTAQITWMKNVSAGIEASYASVPAFVFTSASSTQSFATDFAVANVDGVFMGNNPDENSTTVVDGISYTFGTKTGSYGDHNEDKLGGTYITVTANGKTFAVEAKCFNKTAMQSKASIHLVERYDGSSLVTDAYLAPLWDTNRVYDETGLFVGETGSVTLMFTPTDPKEVVVRDITLGITYTYGLDYTISGNKVTRVAGGHLPYLSYDEYYMKSPAVYNGKEQGWQVTLQNGKTEDGYSFSGTRYMYYNERYEGSEHHVTFTYDKTEAWTGTTFTGDAGAQNFIDTLKTDKEATVFFYGDSITVGCNASGTIHGGMRNPFLPSWTDLTVSYLEKLYGAEIASYNAAVGGWTTAQGAANMATKVTEAGVNLADVDLFVIAFGMNDPETAESEYTSAIKQMINAYYEVNPNGSVLLVSPMQPNTQSRMVAGNQSKWESALNEVKNSSEYASKNVALAKVHTMFGELLTVSGKLSRDYLGNNINHPNDFGMRIYAQVVLKTLCGDDFS